MQKSNRSSEERSVLVPLPDEGFDPTEAAIAWLYLAGAGFRLVFATPSGDPARADYRTLTGQGLGPFRGLLMADPAGVEAYQDMVRSIEFRTPITYGQIKQDRFDAILLAGGHAPGMRVYLESAELQGAITAFFANGRPVGAICHGTLLVARSQSAVTGKSVLYGRRTTGLTYWQEMIAWGLTFPFRGNYYRTYPTPLETEVTSQLQQPDHFSRGPFPFKRDSAYDLATGFTVCDRNYLSARWPGDAHRFSSEFTELVRTWR